MIFLDKHLLNICLSYRSLGLAWILIFRRVDFVWLFYGCYILLI